MFRFINDGFIKNDTTGIIINNNDIQYEQLLEKRKNDKFQKHVLTQIDYLIKEMNLLKEQICQDK